MISGLFPVRRFLFWDSSISFCQCRWAVLRCDLSMLRQYVMAAIFSQRFPSLVWSSISLCQCRWALLRCNLSMLRQYARAAYFLWFPSFAGIKCLYSWLLTAAAFLWEMSQTTGGCVVIVESTLLNMFPSAM